MIFSYKIFKTYNARKQLRYHQKNIYIQNVYKNSCIARHISKSNISTNEKLDLYINLEFIFFSRHLRKN